LHVIGTFRLPPENVPQARIVMRRVIEASLAEDGCVSYAYAQDVFDPGLIRVHEIWQDRSALDRHFTTAHIGEWRSAWASIEIGDRNLTLHSCDEGQPI